MTEPKEIIQCKCTTFRRTVELHIWSDAEYYTSIGLDTIAEITEWANWCVWFIEEHNCNLIWLADYDLDVLAHELVHTAENMCNQCWVELWWEPMAFIVQELLVKIISKSKWKFKLNKRTALFFNEE